MSESIDTSRTTVLLGLGAIIVTLSLASGEWSVYDFGVAVSIVGFGLYFLKSNRIIPMNKWATVLFALPFALVTAAALTAFLSLVAFKYPYFAEVDFETYKAVYTGNPDAPKKPDFEIKKSQATFQWLAFLILFAIWATGFFLWSLYRKKELVKEQEKELAAQSET